MWTKKDACDSGRGLRVTTAAFAAGMLVISIVPACFSGAGGDGTAGAGRCIPGSTQQCLGPNSCTGVQECKESGDAYTSCSCGTSTEGAGGSAGKSGSEANAGMTNVGTNQGGNSGTANYPGASGSSNTTAGTTGSNPSGGTSSVLEYPCAKGAGSDGLIDDFVAEDTTSETRDGRTGEKWSAYGQATLKIGSGYLQCALQNDKQSCGVTLHPICYDATSYGGVRITIRGTGTAVLALKTRDTAPIGAEGGRCIPRSGLDGACGSHFRVIIPELTAEWKTYEFPWNSFTQGAWGQPAPSLYPKQYELMSFIIGADFWENPLPARIEIDDIALF